VAQDLSSIPKFLVPDSGTRFMGGEPVSYAINLMLKSITIALLLRHHAAAHRQTNKTTENPTNTLSFPFKMHRTVFLHINELKRSWRLYWTFWRSLSFPVLSTDTAHQAH